MRSRRIASIAVATLLAAVTNVSLPPSPASAWADQAEASSPDGSTDVTLRVEQQPTAEISTVRALDQTGASSPYGVLGFAAVGALVTLVITTAASNGSNRR